MSERDTYYVIQIHEHPDPFYNGDFWSNETGWGSLSAASVFTWTERISLDLPIEGAWVELPSIPAQVAS